MKDRIQNLAHICARTYVRMDLDRFEDWSSGETKSFGA